MSSFLSILEKENIGTDQDSDLGKRNLGVKMNDMLSAAFKDILEKKSSVYRDMVKKGIDVDFSKSFKFPDNTTGSMMELIQFYNEDMK